MKLYNCDIYSFKKIVSGRKLVSFGAGETLKNFISFYRELHFEEDIHCIADNNKDSLPDKFEIDNIQIPIIRLNQLRKIKDYILLISCFDVYAVYEQLSHYPELNEIACFASNFIRSETNRKEEERRKYPENYRLTQEPLIPKKIHYCWFGKGEIPEQNRKWMDSWKKYCPDYEIIRWDESNYDVTKNDYMYEAYQTKKWGFVPDYARMDIIYNNGGIYLDTDVELLKNLDELLYQQAFAGVDATRKISLGLGFGACKGCNIIKEIRDFYLNQNFKNKDGTLKLISAPKLQTDFFKQKGYIDNGDYQVIENMTIYPEKVLSPKCTFSGQILATDYSFSIHHYDASWFLERRQQRLKNTELLKQAIIIESK